MNVLAKIYDFYQTSKQGIREYSWDLFAYFFVKIYLILLAAANLALWGVAIYINTNLQSSRIALHYNVDFGINLVGNARQIFIIPILGIIIILLNLAIIFSISKNKERVVIAHMLLMASLLANIILIMAIAAIFLINFR